jgi:hypothetical protein
VDRPNSKPDHATRHVISAAAKSGRWFFTAGKWHKACVLDSSYQLRCPNGQRTQCQAAVVMSEKVVSLRGGFTIEPAQPNHTLIEELERLLEAAQAGEIVGMAGTYVHRDKTVSYSYAGAIASYGMLGGLDCVKERLLRIALSKD